VLALLEVTLPLCRVPAEEVQLVVEALAASNVVVSLETLVQLPATGAEVLTISAVTAKLRPSSATHVENWAIFPGTALLPMVVRSTQLARPAISAAKQATSRATVLQRRQTVT
jgi:hypothetical protein